MKKIILSIILAVVVVLGALVIHISMIDWNSHKDRIATQFANVTGKRVEFYGPVEFKIFPSPYLRAIDVKIFGDRAYNEDNKPIAVIKTLYADLSLVPLLRGRFDVTDMLAMEPEMFIDILPDGKMNWQSVDDFDRTGESIDVVLDKFRIENAKVRILSANHGVDLTLDHLNAVVSAEGVFGPYSVEGSYMKDNNPEGFAVILGKFSDTFATSLSFSIRHPKSDSSLRFDGSFFLKNSAVNGSVVVESARVLDFASSYLPEITIDKKYEYPLAASLEINTNKTKLDISNFIIKYGQSTGSGNITIPFAFSEYDYGKTSGERQKIEATFNMAELDLSPISELFKDFTKEHIKEFNPDLGYDFLFDVKSVKTNYKNQDIRDFELSFDVLKDKINLNVLTGFLPGDTSLDVSGVIYPEKDILTYNFDVVSKAEDFTMLADWLSYKVPAINTFTYRKANLSTKVMGNLQNIKISPINLLFDKTQIVGEVGLVRGDKISILADVNMDSFNFDNYLEKMPKEVAEQGLKEEVLYGLSKMSFLNDYNIIFNGKLGLGIWDSKTMDGTSLSFQVNDSKMNLEQFKITSFKNSSMEFSGGIGNIGRDLTFSNLKFDIATQDFYSLFTKNKLPNLFASAKDLRKFEVKGVASGNPSKIALRSVIKLDDITTAYSGEVADLNNKLIFDGKIDFRSSDFVKMLNKFAINYNPRVLTMGIFRINSAIKGSVDNMAFSGMETFIGTNKFVGDVVYKNIAGKDDLSFNLNVNNFEMDRFFYNKSNVSSSSSFQMKEDAKIDFLAKPILSKMKIDYGFVDTFNLNGRINVGNLSYQQKEFKDASFDLNMKNSIMNIDNFKANFGVAKILAKIMVDMNNKTMIKGDVSLSEYKIKDGVSGEKYGLIDGEVDKALLVFSSVVSSEDDFLTSLDGGLDFSIKNPEVKGWDLGQIYALVKEKNSTENFDENVSASLEKGTTRFDSMAGKIVFSKGSYKLEDISYIATDFDVKTIGTGSLNLWDINSFYDVSFKNLEDKMNVTFDMKGPLSSPKVVSDASKIKEYYEKKASELEAERLAKLEQKQKDLADKLGVFGTRIFEDKSYVNDKLIKKIEEKDLSSSTIVIQERYNSILEQSKKIDSMLEKAINIIDKTEYEDSDVSEVSLIQDKVIAELEKVNKDLESADYQDGREKVNQRYNELADKYVATRTNVGRFRDAYMKFPPRLIVMGKSFLIENYPEMNEHKKNIEAIFIGLDSQNTEASKDYIHVQTLNDVNSINEYIKKVDTMLDNYRAKEPILESSIKGLLEGLEAMISNQEKEYDNMVIEQKTKNKIEESKGSISSSTGKNLSIVKDASEINLNDDNVDKGNVKVLDFSNKSKEGSSSIKKVFTREEIKQKIIEKTDGKLLKEIDGEVSATAGVINKN